MSDESRSAKDPQAVRAPMPGSGRPLSWTAAFLLLPAVAWWMAQGRTSREVPETRSVTWDAGPVFPDDMPTLRHDFAVRNDTGADLEIVGQACTCTCTTNSLDRKRLKPGESATLSVSMHTPYSLVVGGSVRCSLTFSDGTTRGYLMRYSSFPRLAVEDLYLNFGEFTEGGASEAGLETIVRVFHEGDRPAPRLSLSDGLDGFDVRLEPQGSKDAAPGVREETNRLTVTPDRDALLRAPPGDYTGTLAFTTRCC